jgi:hypothetical protein
LQRRRVVLIRRTHRLDILENGVGVFGLFQRLGLLEPFEAIVHAIQNRAHRPLFGDVLGGIPPGSQRGADLAGRQIRVAACRLQLRIGLRVRFDDAANVGGQLGILLFPTWPGAGGEVFQTANARLPFAQSLGDGASSPAEPRFGLTGTGPAERLRGFGHKEPALMAFETLGGVANEVMANIRRTMHGGFLPAGETF